MPDDLLLPAEAARVLRINPRTLQDLPGRTISLTHILGMEDVVRVQDPEILETEGENPRYYIRPYVDTFDENGHPAKRQVRIYLGRVAEMKKRDAIKRKNEVMATVNRCQYVLQAQMNFGTFLDHYEREYVLKPANLAASTQAKYICHLRNHIRPAFADLPMGEISTRTIDAMLSQKARDGMAWSTRVDLRNLMCGIFTQAERWGLWKDKNPALAVTVGRKRIKRALRKLTTGETRALLESLPVDVRLVCETALYCALRISEVLGLQWKHVDFPNGLILIRQRWYRGDLDTVKSERSRRDIPMGVLAGDLAAIYPGGECDEDFVFSVRTHLSREKSGRICRDDRGILQHFLRPAAKSLGLHYEGFGFHAFRRDAVTEYSRSMGSNQAQRMAGHSRADMSLHYTQADREAQEVAVRELQGRIRNVVPIKKEA